MSTKVFDKIFNNNDNDNDNEQNQLCKNCNDVKICHPINLCYKYEAKFKKIEKQIVKPISWSNYFKSYFVELQPEFEIEYSEKPVYFEKCNPTFYEKIHSSFDLTNFQFIETYKLPETCNTILPPLQPPTPNLIQTNDWLVKLEYIMNGMWIDITNYLLNNVYNLLKPVKYITENDIKIQINNQTDEIEQIKNEIKNMKSEMLFDIKHKINNEFIILNNSDNNYKVIIDKNIQEIKNKLKNTENINQHKQKSKELMQDIKSLKSKLKTVIDYEKIEA
jgi:hypothetical protein